VRVRQQDHHGGPAKYRGNDTSARLILSYEEANERATLRAEYANATRRARSDGRRRYAPIFANKMRGLGEPPSL
jgi:hypothetical protein